jgi:molybdopterin converting factor small subunit
MLKAMTVTVKLHGLLRPYHPGPNRSTPLSVELADDATVQAAADALKLPLELTRMVMLNDVQAKLGDALTDGDRIGFFTVLVGGSR